MVISRRRPHSKIAHEHEPPHRELLLIRSNNAPIFRKKPGPGVPTGWKWFNSTVLQRSCPRQIPQGLWQGPLCLDQALNLLYDKANYVASVTLADVVQPLA